MYKTLSDFPDYLFCDDGSIYSTKYNKMRKLKFSINQRGYYTCRIKHANGYFVSKSVHRLLAMAFKDDYNSELQVDHINGNKLDNHIDNLEMVTASINMQRAFQNGLATATVLKGSDNGRSKQVIIKNVENNQTIVFESLTSCARYLETSLSSIKRHNRNNKPLKNYLVSY